MEESLESSRKSSVSSGRPKSKQFAVTLLVSEADKNKIVDMLQRAKSVISKKVEKVIGKKPPKSGISNAAALTTVLQNWVEDEEKREQDDESEVDQLIEQQVEQAVNMRQLGVEPPITVVTPPPPPTDAYKPTGGVKTVISPVPEEDEDADDDLEVQEVKEGQENLLRLPPNRRYRLSRSNTRSPASRSLSPCDNVPRYFSRPESELYPANLRRPSSHYDSNAQNASSRPQSRQETSSPVQATMAAAATSDTSMPYFNYPTNPFVFAAEEQQRKADPKSREMEASKDVIRFDYDDTPVSSFQRPDSMTIPIGGVWRPGQSDDEDDFMKNLSIPTTETSTTRVFERERAPLLFFAFDVPNTKCTVCSPKRLNEPIVTDFFRF